MQVETTVMISSLSFRSKFHFAQEAAKFTETATSMVQNIIPANVQDQPFFDL